MNRITKFALAAPAVLAIVGGLVFARVNAATQGPTATQTPAAQPQAQAPSAPPKDGKPGGGENEKRGSSRRRNRNRSGGNRAKQDKPKETP